MRKTERALLHREPRAPLASILLSAEEREWVRWDSKLRDRGPKAFSLSLSLSLSLQRAVTGLGLLEEAGDENAQ